MRPARCRPRGGRAGAKGDDVMTQDVADKVRANTDQAFKYVREAQRQLAADQTDAVAELLRVAGNHLEVALLRPYMGPGVTKGEAIAAYEAVSPA